MKTDVKELLEKVATVAGFSDEEKNAVLSTLKDETVIEGDLASSILTKSNGISSRDFVLNDPSELKQIYDRVMGENMPNVEAGSLKALLSSLDGIVSEEDLKPVWENPENKKLNNKVFESGKVLKSKINALIEQAKKGDGELQEEAQKAKTELVNLQKAIDANSAAHQEEITKLERKHTNQLFGFKLIQDMKAWGADVTGLERGISLQISQDYHTDLDATGKPVLRQKDNPEAAITDPKTNTTLTYKDVIMRDFASLFKRNNGGQEAQKVIAPTNSPKQPQGNYPASIVTDKQKKHWDDLQAKRAAKKG